MFARFEFRGKAYLQTFVLIGQLLPTAAIIVPLFITLRYLHLINTYWGLILVYHHHHAAPQRLDA